MVRPIAAKPVIPAAKPSNPSNQFTAFITPTIQKVLIKKLKDFDRYIVSVVSQAISILLIYIPDPVMKEANNKLKK